MTSGTIVSRAAEATPSAPAVDVEEFYSSWSLFLVCMLLILSLWTSYYLQIKRIRAVHETLVSIVAGMAVGLVIRLAPGTLIREMLVSALKWGSPDIFQLRRRSYKRMNISRGPEGSQRNGRGREPRRERPLVDTTAQPISLLCMSTSAAYAEVYLVRAAIRAHCKSITPSSRMHD
jgi:hypothetical protein